MEAMLQQIAILAIPVIFAITLHEAAHGYAARHFGDFTAFKLGRISLNPARHIDPVGTLLIPAITYFVGGMLFGWAKPVPVDFGNLRNPKHDMRWVAFAGPLANLLMALFWGVMMKVAMVMDNSYFSLPLALMANEGVKINVVLMLLNLVPILPLDGGRIAVSLLPDRLAWRYAQLEPYGLMILVILLFSGALGSVLNPLFSLSGELIYTLFDVNF